MDPRELATGRRTMNATDPDGRPTYGDEEIAKTLRVSRSTVIQRPPRSVRAGPA